MVKARKYIVKQAFKGVPKREDFEIVEYEMPPLKDGEILIKTEWIGVDPFQRGVAHLLEVPYDMFGYIVGTVVDSKNLKYPKGTKVVSFEGWCTYTIVNADSPPVNKYFKNTFYKLPDLQGLPESLGVGTIGMPGVSAYFGLLDVCNPKAGETVVVTGAAGACGSIVGQIAKIKGCKVIGFAGSDEKVNRLQTELGFDKAFNYKTVDVVKVLKEAAPDGIDCYFDNVGGEISSAIISQMRPLGRVTVLGSISAYNENGLYDYSTLPKVTILQPFILMNQITVQGFSYANVDFSRWPGAFDDLTKWIKSGQLKAPEHITEGFDNLYDAFVGMLAGENFGKSVVKV
ncbi:hypothetical protein ABMA28_015132 [Loxostege sticticalis]|uniref:Prostaglandin reductase 1 n=1 Tax=Loxostege sticticalis TaxID=481309 RepID=A0ABD0TEF5_LOXSC